MVEVTFSRPAGRSRLSVNMVSVIASFAKTSRTVRFRFFLLCVSLADSTVPTPRIPDCSARSKPTTLGTKPQ